MAAKFTDYIFLSRSEPRGWTSGGDNHRRDPNRRALLGGERGHAARRDGATHRGERAPAVSTPGDRLVHWAAARVPHVAKL